MALSGRRCAQMASKLLCRQGISTPTLGRFDLQVADLAVEALEVGFGRIVVSETEAPNMLANLV
jgi:hypothetical protein